MPPDRDLDRELRDLGAHVEYPPTPDLARSVRLRLEAGDGTAGSPSRNGPRLWWIAAAALVLLLALPVFAAVLDGMGGALSGGAGVAGGGAGSGGRDAADPAGPSRPTGDGSLAAGAEEDGPEGGMGGALEAGGGAGETGRPNEPVPDVVGMELTAACEKLASGGYVGYVVRAVDDPGVRPGRVVGQRPPAGDRGYVGGPVDLTVSEPFSGDGPRRAGGRNPACLDATR